MTRRLVVGMLAVALATVGCIGAEMDDAGDDVAPAGAPAFGAASGLPTAPGEPTLAQAPSWAVGQWWTYRLVAEGSGMEETFTLVVAGAEAGGYLVGFPADEVPILPFIYHLPGVGQVSGIDLSYEAHDEPFELLRFPLTEGLTWDGVRWGLAPMTLTVQAVDGTAAELTMESGSNTAAYTYDAAVGALTHHRVPADGPLERELELVDHGLGYQGAVMVPYGQDLTLCHGRTTAVQGIEGCQGSGPSSPSGSLEVPPGYTAASFALIINRGSAEGTTTPGAAAISVTDPHGNRYDAAAAPGQGDVLQGHHLADPAGTWSYDAAVASNGFAIVEGVTYIQVVVELPDGCFVDSEPEGFAGSTCNPG